MIWPWKELKRLRIENEQQRRSLEHIRLNYDFWRAEWMSRTRDLYAAHKGIRRLKNKLLRQPMKNIKNILDET